MSHSGICPFPRSLTQLSASSFLIYLENPRFLPRRQKKSSVVPSPNEASALPTRSPLWKKPSRTNVWSEFCNLPRPCRRSSTPTHFSKDSKNLRSVKLKSPFARWPIATCKLILRVELRSLLHPAAESPLEDEPIGGRGEREAADPVWVAGELALLFAAFCFIKKRS